MNPTNLGSRTHGFRYLGNEVWKQGERTQSLQLLQMSKNMSCSSPTHFIKAQVRRKHFFGVKLHEESSMLLL